MRDYGTAYILRAHIKGFILLLCVQIVGDLRSAAFVFCGAGTGGVAFLLFQGEDRSVRVHAMLSIVNFNVSMKRILKKSLVRLKYIFIVYTLCKLI
jgi:uncharacterized membrane protein